MSTVTADLTVGDFRNLMDLRACDTRGTLRKAWLALSPDDRARLRHDPRLAAHAERVLDADRASGST